jgi:hypothetical protein
MVGPTLELSCERPIRSTLVSFNSLFDAVVDLRATEPGQDGARTLLFVCDYIRVVDLHLQNLAQPLAGVSAATLLM